MLYKATLLACAMQGATGAFVNMPAARLAGQGNPALFRLESSTPVAAVRSRHAVMEALKEPETPAEAAPVPASPPADGSEEERPPHPAEALTSEEDMKTVEVISQELFAKATAPNMETSWRRAAFWEPGKASLLELINVLGRFDSCDEWITRNIFVDLWPGEERDETDLQALTLKRHEMAKRMKCAERAALFQNAPSLPFKNAKLAAAVGLTVEDFNRLPVTKDACNVLYDALAESRSTLIPYNTMDARTKAMVDKDGNFDETAFRIGHTKSTILFTVGLFLFGKANFIWVILAAKFAHDFRPDLIPGPKELGLFKIWGIV